MQNLSIKFHVRCSSFTVLAWFEEKRPTRERGRGPNRPKGRANGEPATKLGRFSEKATAEGPHEKQQYEATFGRTLRKRHCAELCESDTDGSKTAPTPVNLHRFGPFSKLNFLFRNLSLQELSRTDHIFGIHSAVIGQSLVPDFRRSMRIETGRLKKTQRVGSSNRIFCLKCVRSLPTEEFIVPPEKELDTKWCQ